MTLPTRLILDDLTEEFCRTGWFANLGARAEPADRALAKDYFAKLGLPGLIGVWLHDLGAAAALLQRGGTYPPWEKAEQALGEALSGTAGEVLGETAASEAVNRAMLAASDAAMAAARRIFPGKGHDKESLMRVAAGAAARTAGDYALVLLAGADPATHAFAAKQRLFAAGRWPLIAIDEQFALL
jgi:hypothetical protein